MNTMEGKHLLVIYDLQQLPGALARREKHPDMQIVCLDFWIERELKKNAIPYISLRDFMDTEKDEEEWWLLAQDVAREWYRLPAMGFFEYKNIPIAEALEPVMEMYLSKLFYYVRIFAAIKTKYLVASLHVPPPIVDDAPTAGCLISFERWAVVDAARMTGLQNVTPAERAAAPKGHLFPRIIWKSLLIHVYNAAISLVPRRRLKIYASEYWSHIGPIIKQMDDAELVLMEISELKHISWRQILKHRIRIQHPADTVRGAIRRAAMRTCDAFIKQWGTAKGDVAGYLAHKRRELDWDPVFEACEYIITYSPRVVADIEALYSIMEEEKPDVVIQLASVGGRQHHFFLMARVAAQLAIPSIELQHSAASIDPRSAFSRLETDYLATYGEHTSEWYARLGIARERIIAVGSPRFDRYTQEYQEAREKGVHLLRQFGLDEKCPILLAAVPYLNPSLSPFAVDSYRLVEFFQAIRIAQRAIPGMQVLFKFRDDRHIGPAREYLQELFPAGWALVGTTDLFALLCASTAVVCGNSTVMYQSMLAKIPIVFFPWGKFDTYHAQMHASTAPFVWSTEELAKTLGRLFSDANYCSTLLREHERILKEYLFDGRSSERVASLLRKGLAPLRQARDIYGKPLAPK